jgi:hypothetical protein
VIGYAASPPRLKQIADSYQVLGPVPQILRSEIVESSLTGRVVKKLWAEFARGCVTPRIGRLRESSG